MTLPALPKTISAVLLALALALLAFASAAHAAAPVLSVSVRHSPEIFQRGDTGDSYELVVTNTGDTPTSGPITITDTLPSAIEVEKVTPADQTNVHCETVVQPICTTSLSIAPAESLSIGLLLATALDAPATLTSTVTVSGGSAPETSTGDTVPVVDRPAFAIEDFNAHALDEAGHDYTPAGGHSYEATASFSLPTYPVSFGGVDPVEDFKDVFTELPPGFLGDAAAAARCTEAQLVAPGFFPHCPAASQVGTLALSQQGRPPAQLALFNMVPEKGYPAEFGFKFGLATPVIVYTRLRPRTGGYGVTVATPGAPRLSWTGAGITLWGIPSKHNGSGGPEIPFLINPVNCQEAEPTTTNIVDSWENPAREFPAPNFGNPDLTDPLWKVATFVSPAVTECDNPALASQFKPSIDVEPLQSSSVIQADEPSGLKVDLDFPQSNDPTDLHTIFNPALPQAPELKTATVTLPAGVSISPSSAGGLGACSDQTSDPAGDQVHYDDTEPVSCPDSSKIGTISATSPLLPSHDPVTDAITGAEPIGGDVYVLKPHPGDFPPGGGQAGTFRILIQAESAKNGINVKLPGTAVANPTTGQLTATFTENPQLPVKHLEVDFKTGPRAPLATPVTCGTYTTTTDLVPWSTPGTPDAHPSSAFQVAGGANGAACPTTPQQRPFSPAMSAGTQSTTAGASSPFVLHLTRNDGEQELTNLNLTMPPGFAARLAGIPYCSEAAIAAASGKTGREEEAGPSCPTASQVGSLTTGAGPGTNPYYVNGKAYLAGPYKGAPLSLVFVTPAIAGPFDLGSVVVRAALFIDRGTAQVTVKTGPIPQIIDGVPLRIRSILARIDRPGFTLNPTNCSSMNITGEALGSSGATSALSSHFQVGGCAGLRFAPKFSVSTTGQASKANGASLTAKLTYPYAAAGAVNLTKVKVELPKQLPSRLTTLQKACTSAQFEANPAGCPSASVIGHATVNTPILPVPLTGPAYFVSHGGEAFPSLVIVLQGYGITVNLIGTTFISKAGITSTTFKTVPDVPFTTFELTLPQGKFSALGANLPAKSNYNFCSQKMVMPTEMIAQNGAAIRQNTKIATTGCKAGPTKAQKLAAALKACKKKHRAKRAACARTARRQYGTAARRTRK